MCIMIKRNFIVLYFFFLCFKLSWCQEFNQTKVQEGIDLYLKGAFDAAIELLTACIDPAVKSGDSLALQSIYTNLGNAYSSQGVMERALENYQKGLDIAFHTSDTARQARILSNIGTIYSDTKDFPMALEFFEKSEKLALLINDEMTLADCANGRALIYEQEGKNEEALELYTKTLEIYSKHNLKDRLALTYNNLGIVYKQLGRLDQTIYFYNKALELAEEIEANYIVAAIASNLANVYLLQNQYEEAIHANLQAQQKAREIGATSIAVETYGNLMDVYAAMQHYQKAYEYAVLYKQANDSLINVERTAQLAEMKEKYETEKKKSENITLREQNKVKELQLNEKSLQLANRNLMLMGSFSVLLLSGVVVWLYLSRQKSKNRTLRILAVKESEKQERIRIAQDLHDDLGAGLTKIGFIGALISNDLAYSQSNTHGKTIKETVKQLSDSIKILIWSLNSESLSRGEFVSYIRQYAYDYFEDFSIAVHFQSTIANPEKSLSKDEFRQLFMTIKEGLNNIAKYAEATEVSIIFNDDDDEKFSVIIKDNGKGFDETVVKKGNGLNNIRKRMASIQGEIAIVSEPQQGTTIKIKIG